MSETKSKQATTDMTTGSPAKLICLFALPLLAGNVLQQLYNMVDSIVVGNFVGDAALAAVGTGFPVISSYRLSEYGSCSASVLPV